MTRPGTSGAAPGPAGPGDPAPDPADIQEVPDGDDESAPDDADYPDDADDASAPDDGGIVTAGDRHPADEHPLASFASDPRMPIWIRRGGPGRRGRPGGRPPARLARRPDRRGRRGHPGHGPPVADHRGDPRRGAGHVRAAAHPAAPVLGPPVRLPDPEQPGHPRHQLHHRSSGRRPGRGVRGGLRAVGPQAAAPGHPGRPPLPRSLQPDRPAQARPAGSGRWPGG